MIDNKSMANDDAQPLIGLLFEKQRQLDQELLHRLEEAGWKGLHRAHSLVFGELAAGCGHTSQIAKRLGVSRQAVHRTVMELVDAGYLRLEEDDQSRRLKTIKLTKKGVRVSADANRIFVNLERGLARTIGKGAVASFRKTLESEWKF